MNLIDALTAALDTTEAYTSLPARVLAEFCGAYKSDSVAAGLLAVLRQSDTGCRVSLPVEHVKHLLTLSPKVD